MEQEKQYQYVSKDNLSYFQTIPVPEDLENWYKIELVLGRSYMFCKYEPETDEIVYDEEALQKSATRKVNEAVDGLTLETDSEYPASERATFDSQYKEALDIKAGAGKATPILDALANMRGEPIEALAEKVLEKRQMADIKHLQILSKRRELMAQAESIKTPDELNDFCSGLEQLKASTCEVFTPKINSNTNNG